MLTYEATHGTDTYTGEAAHIKGEKPTAARYDATMADEERDDVDNLIYMCGDHHTIIDKVEADWPVDKLTSLKTDHEAKVRALIEEGFASVAFPELVAAVGWVSSEAPVPLSADFGLLPPEEKILKNQLSNGSRHIIAAGLSSRRTVGQFVESEAQLDPDFPERLKSGFLARYHELRSKGHKGDVLFELMCGFSQRGAKNQAERTAGIAILVYLFEICDVFEK
ncbi:HNH endonuclease [Sinorhizobium meliloti]|uniref:HNH endonuclease n=1 Tax=Rhizobium meliloti TaxID=382 RepID=UPI0003812743|nr:HNH endonuclease [Sinorhizobium meliloti]